MCQNKLSGCSEQICYTKKSSSTAFEEIDSDVIT